MKRMEARRQIIGSQAAVFINSYDEKRREVLTAEPPRCVSVYCFVKLACWLVSEKTFFLFISALTLSRTREEEIKTIHFLSSHPQICRQLFLLITSTPVTPAPP